MQLVLQDGLKKVEIEFENVSDNDSYIKYSSCEMNFKDNEGTEFKFDFTFTKEEITAIYNIMNAKA